MGKRGWQRASLEEDVLSAKEIGPVAATACADGEGDVPTTPKRMCTRRCQCVCTVGTLVVLVGSALVTFALMSILAPPEDPAATLDRRAWSGIVTGMQLKVLPPIPPPLPPPPPRSPPTRCLDQNPKAEFCTFKESKGLCDQRRIVLQCALTCGACEEAVPKLPPPQGPPFHPPSQPPRRSPPLRPSPSPPLRLPPRPTPLLPPSSPEQPAICSKLSRLQEVTGYCYEGSDRQTSRAKCENTYVRLVASAQPLQYPDHFLPCVYDDVKAKCKGRFPAVLCPGLIPPPAPRAPPSPPMQPRPPPESVANLLNARFLNAVPGSSKLSDIGVIMHAFDATEDPQSPWAPCPLDNEICGFLHDRVSTSAVYFGKTVASSVKHGGVVLNPNVARVKCGYVGDGGTREKACLPGADHRCVSGCGIFEPEHDPNGVFRSVFCDAQSTESGWCGGYPWRRTARGATRLAPNPVTLPRASHEAQATSVSGSRRDAHVGSPSNGIQRAYCGRGPLDEPPSWDRRGLCHNVGA